MRIPSFSARFGAQVLQTKDNTVTLKLSEQEKKQVGPLLHDIFGSQLDIHQPLTILGPRPQFSHQQTYLFLTKPEEDRGLNKPSYAKFTGFLEALLAKPQHHDYQNNAQRSELEAVLRQVKEAIEYHARLK